jgi:hypothetical protein
LRAQHHRRAEVVFAQPLDDRVELPGAEVLKRDGRTLALLVDLDPNPLLAFLAQCQVESVTIAPPSLNDIFAGFYETESTPR